MSFASLKKKSGSFDKLTQQIEKMSKPQGAGPDERLWKPGVDKSGNGYAVIRFLPEPDGEDLPWAQVWSHAFQGPGGWYIENSLTTLGQKDPVSEHNRELWNSGLDSDKDTVRKQKRKLSYYANIYVVQDKANPQNEGKVFLYKFGKKIFDKVMEAMQPEFEDETPINPFDFWQGANFKLKLKKVAGYWNYDSSEFDRPAPLLDDDDAMEAVWKKQYSLTALTAADQFKSYDQLENRLNMVLGKKNPPARYDEETANEDSDRGSYSPDFNSRQESKPVPANLKEELNNLSPTKTDEDEDDALSYFQRLAEE